MSKIANAEKYVEQSRFFLKEDAVVFNMTIFKLAIKSFDIFFLVSSALLHLSII